MHAYILEYVYFHVHAHVYIHVCVYVCMCVCMHALCTNVHSQFCSRVLFMCSKEVCV